MEVLITESVPHKDLESVTLADEIRFAIEQGFEVTISSDEFSIQRGDELVFHQKFFGGKIAGVMDYLTAMSKATGMYRVNILQRLIPDKGCEDGVWPERPWSEFDRLASLARAKIIFYNGFPDETDKRSG